APVELVHVHGVPLGRGEEAKEVVIGRSGDLVDPLGDVPWDMAGDVRSVLSVRVTRNEVFTDPFIVPLRDREVEAIAHVHRSRSGAAFKLRSNLDSHGLGGQDIA